MESKQAKRSEKVIEEKEEQWKDSMGLCGQRTGYVDFNEWERLTRGFHV